jgi:hypothetical protein
VPFAGPRTPIHPGNSIIGDNAMKQLVFPCGASYDLRHDELYPLEGAHVTKDGSMRMAVAGTGCTPPKLPDGSHAPCLFDCLKPGRHSKQQRVYEGISGDKLGWMATCHGRLFEDGVDTTPVLTGPCPHCHEQRAYESACRRAARSGNAIPDRREFVDQIKH